MSKWISVKDRLPLDMNDKEIVSRKYPYATVNVITYFRLGDFDHVGCHDYAVGCTLTPWGNFVDCNDNITHWMPLPEPPEIKRRK